MTFPVAKVIASSRSINPRYSPLILRPKMTESERDKFVIDIKGLVGKSYDLLELFKIILTMGKVLKRKQRILGDSIRKSSNFICTEVILDLLIKNSKDFKVSLEKAYPSTDLGSKGYLSPDDFFVLNFFKARQ